MRKYLCLGAAALLFSAISTTQAGAGQFYIATGEWVPKQMTLSHLVQYPYAIKKLGNQNSNGWSVTYADKGQAITIRSELNVSEDPRFETVVSSVAERRPPLLIAHLRRAASGCVEGVENPHPFHRTKMARDWIFGHSGRVNKALLLELIGEEYLTANRPVVCPANPPESWVESELLFLYFLKVIEDNQGNAKLGLVRALVDLYRMLPNEERKLNFYLSDGETVWVFRKGSALWFAEDLELKLTALTSTRPDGEDGPWSEFPEDRLAIIQPQEEIRFLSILDFGSHYHDFEY